MLIITFVSILSLANNARSGFIENDKNENVKRVVRGAYKYNHPPSAEYLSVPVAVFYEESDRQEKSVDNVSTSREYIDLTHRKKESTVTEETILEPSKDDKDIEKHSNQKETNIKSSKKITKSSIQRKTTEVAETILKPKNEQDVKEIIEKEPIESVSDAHEIDSITHAIETTSNIPKDLNTIPDKNNDSKQEVKITEPHDGLIIPVAVVYDVVPENLQRSTKSHVLKRRKPISRQQRNKNSGEISEVSENVKDKQPKERFNENNKSVSFPKRTQERDPIVPIVQSENYVFSHSGDFHYSYEGGDGTKAFERGQHSDNAGGAVEGSFSYIGKDGKDYSLTYTADENGYRPVGDHLPTPPPIPPAIARALKYLATKPTSESITESYY